MPIFDQGYQHWNGQLTSQALRWWEVTLHGVRIGMKSQLLRIIVIVAWLPAALLAVVLCGWGLLEQKSDLIKPFMGFLSALPREMLDDPIAYRIEAWTICYHVFLWVEIRLAMIVVLLVGPSLISRDLRFNAIPLYFSRPVRRIDYFVGKLGVIGVFLGMVLVVPSVIAYVLGMLFSLDFSIIRDTISLLLAAITYGAVMTLSAGLLILALSTLSRNSRYIGLFWIGIWFLTTTVGTVLEAANEGQMRNAAYERMMKAEQSRRSTNQPRNNADFQQEWRAQMEMRAKIQEEIHQELLASAKTDWRPLVSYTANLGRIGQPILGTDACWIRLSKLEPPEQQSDYLLEKMGPQYPWYWSGAVLAILFGISVCILNFRVRSLDRLK